MLCPLITEEIMKSVSIFKTASSHHAPYLWWVQFYDALAGDMSHVSLAHLHIIRYMGELGRGWVVRLTDLFLLRQYYIFVNSLKSFNNIQKALEFDFDELVLR